ncbi:hypothetical protein DU478_18395 [Thalassococcus profundi]|uniref:Uncharacterized protein n=1 Tax=Thalassococcus profundi TaxID=2282382 RepID=A0A369TH82_9RHOB|nr:hypothetical protein [Thalassococcus profundi]RDD64709.1 hypothetical protein DU478_18395 [Thalassococcus profundi]
MADRALTEEALIAGLRDIRLPEHAAGGLPAELLAAAAIGLLIAAVLGLAVRALSFAKVPRRAAPAVPPGDERLALLRRLKTQAPERYAQLARDLYRPGGVPDLDTLRAEVARHA